MIVTEYMNGGSLAHVFSKPQPISMMRAAQMGIETARGMAYLHNKNQSSVCIIHRDLKPANLMIGGHRAETKQAKEMMLNETGIVKIADFGLSKSVKTRLHRIHAARNVEDMIGSSKEKLLGGQGRPRSTSYKMTGRKTEHQC